MAYGTSRVYRNPRPSLTVDSTGGARLGNCYHAMYFRVTSLRALSMKNLWALREAGFLGYGQEFSAHQVVGDSKVPVPAELDWRTTKDVAPSGQDDVPCVEVDDRTGEVLRNPSINPYSGKEDQPTKISYFVYECEDRCDSGD